MKQLKLSHVAEVLLLSILLTNFQRRFTKMADRTTHENLDIEYFFGLYPDLLCIADADGFLKKINPAVPKVLGYSQQELYGSPLDKFIHPQDRVANKERIARQVSGELVSEYVNRYIAKDGRVVWLSWTSVFIERDQLLFSIAKDITSKRLIEEHTHFSVILERLGEQQRKRFSAEVALVKPDIQTEAMDVEWMNLDTGVSLNDRAWLHKFSMLVRTHAPRFELNLKFLSSEMAMSERQLYRQVKRLVKMTPKAFILRIRFHMVWELIASQRHYSIRELARIAGYSNVKRFKTSFYDRFGIEVVELL